MNIFKKFIALWQRRSNTAYINFLRKKGISIGTGTICKFPRTIEIDISRPELLTIGKNVLLHKGLTILTHDFASRVFVNLYNDFIPSHGKVQIGNNVWFGEHCTVLKGVTIGDNCIIGYGSIVIKDIPANSVAVGCPAKVICTIQEYYEKRKKVYINEVFEYAYAIEKCRNRPPVPNDFKDDYPVFVDSTNIDTYPFPYMTVFKNVETLKNWEKHHKAPFGGFDKFMDEYKKWKQQYES